MRQRRVTAGYSLQMTMILLAVLAAALGGMLALVTAGGKSTGAAVQRRQGFYACEGIARGVVHLAQQYVAQDASATADELTAFICAQAGGCEGAVKLPLLRLGQFGVEEFSVQLENARDGVIPNGPFSGMNATLTDLSFSLRARRAGGNRVCSTTQSGTLGQIAMFQFFLFGDGYVDWFPGPAQDVRGRSHANDDFCFGSGSAFRLARVTSAGRLMHGSHPGCRTSGTTANQARIATSGTFTTFSDWTDATDHGCTGCGGTGLAWQAYATATWGNNAQDVAHGVPRLRLPVSSTAEVQASVNADGVQVNNRENSRLLIDPVRAADGDDVRAQKFACKADVRVLNGVWYVRENPTDADPCDWPGTPIWSDHPGEFPAPLTNEDDLDTRVVGQRDLYTARGWSGIPVGYPERSIPARYSYYRSDVTAPGLGAYPEGALLPPVPGKTPVVSYGSLVRDGSGAFPVWRPGHWVSAGEPSLCDGASVTGAGGIADATLPGAGEFALCGAGTLAPVTSALLNATRSGFQDGHVQQGAPSDGVARSRVLPLNFDVAAFLGALQDASTGELGSYFGPGSLTGRDFNGIVYLGATWPGALGGFPDGLATLPPLQGAQSDPSFPQTGDVAAHPAGQEMLPYPLCAVPGSPTFAPGSTYDDVGHPRFFVPSCDDYAAGGARPSAVRIINARDLLPADPTVLPRGLTLATHLPAYVVGDANVTSDVSSGTALPWKPLLVAADQVMLLSSAWDDALSNWTHLAASTTRNAVSTAHHLAILAGWSESANGKYSGGVENFPRYLERWSGVQHKLVGSLVVGFNSAYYRWPRAGGGAYSPPNRDWSFDDHFQTILNQPPGAPRYDIYAIRRFGR